MEEHKIDNFCPCLTCAETTIIGYRFLRDPLSDPNNLDPPYIIDMKKDLSAGSNIYNNLRRHLNGTPQKICGSLGLSFYRSAHEAEKAYISNRGLKNLSPPYTCIGECALAPSDGVVSAISNRGHFDLHPYNTNSLSSKFSCSRFI